MLSLILIFVTFEKVQAQEMCLNLFRYGIDEAGYTELPPAKPDEPKSKVKAAIERLRQKLFGDRADVSTKEFEIWIVQNKNEPAFYDRATLAALAKKKVQGMLVQMKEQGFEPRHQLKFIIQNSENAISVKEVTESGAIKGEWKDYTEGAMVIHLPEFDVGFQQPNGTVKQLKTGKSKEAFAILFTKASDFFHYFEHDFVILHELAHTTENPQSLRSLYWREARADFLAYAFSGISNILIRGGLNIRHFDPNNGLVVQRTEKIRSLSEPMVAKAQDVEPRYDHYHHNSQPISAALYDFAQVIGIENALELVRKLDNKSIVDYRIVPDSDDGDQGSTAYHRVISTISRELGVVGLYLKREVLESDLSEADRRRLIEILIARGLLRF